MPRHREFEPDDVVDRAMERFWSHGYESTSIEDLVQATGLNRGSLYNTFGDKRGLFLAAMDRYANVVLAEMVTLLEADGSGLASIRIVFETMAEVSLRDRNKRGCFLTNTAVALLPHDDEVGERVAGYFARMERAFRRALEHARASGELGKEKDIDVLAQYLITSLQGLLVMRKTPRESGSLRNVVDVTLSALA